MLVYLLRWIDMSKAIPDWALTKLSGLLSCVFCVCTKCCGKWNLVRETQIVNREGEESAFANEFHRRVTECSWIRKGFVLFIILCKFSLCANLANFGTVLPQILKYLEYRLILRVSYFFQNPTPTSF